MPYPEVGSPEEDGVQKISTGASSTRWAGALLDPHADNGADAGEGIAHNPDSIPRRTFTFPEG